MIGNTFQFAWEVKLIEWCQTNLPSPLISIFKLSSYLGDTYVIVGIMVFVYLCYDKKLGKRIIYNLLFSLVFAAEVKNVAKRRRPYFDNKNVECLKIVDSKYDLYDVMNQGYSFPSMHSSNTTVLFGTLLQSFKTKFFYILGILLPVIVGVSRFVLGCHYPTDVLFGWLLGIFSIVCLGKLQDKLDEKYSNIILLVVGFIGIFFCESSDYFSALGIIIGFVIARYLDRKYIDFKNTKNVIKRILRVIIAVALFLGVAEGMKLFFADSILEANNAFAYFYRTLRYCLATFISMGITPILYKYNLLKMDD